MPSLRHSLFHLFKGPSLSACLRCLLFDGAKMAKVVLLLAFALLLLVTPTFCTAGRVLRDADRSDVRNLSEEKHEFEKRSSNWNDQQSGDDGVPASSSTVADNTEVKYKNWVRYQEELVTQDYGDTPAAANPSVPCC